MSDPTDTGANRPETFICPQTTSVGVYVLAAMNSEGAAAMRTHIDGCLTCAGELRRLAPVAKLLSGADPVALGAEASDAVPARVREQLFARADAELADEERTTATSTFGRPRRRTRRLLVAASAASFLLGAGSVVGVERLSASKTTAEPPGERVKLTGFRLPPGTPSDPHEEPRAWVQISTQPAGTYVALHAYGLVEGRSYKWWFVQQDGSRVPLGSFRYVEGEAADGWQLYPGHTAVDRAQLVAIGLTDQGGVDIVNTPLPTPI